jgi:hypothetical protein
MDSGLRADSAPSPLQGLLAALAEIAIRVERQSGEAGSQKSGEAAGALQSDASPRSGALAPQEKRKSRSRIGPAPRVASRS